MARGVITQKNFIMEKKAKIIATLGPAIYSENKLKQLINLGVDAFRINFSHNTNGINKIVSKIRKIEKILKKKIFLIADLQGVKLRVGKIKKELGWEPSESLDTGLNKTIQWYLNNPQWIERVMSGAYKGQRLGLKNMTESKND